MLKFKLALASIETFAQILPREPTDLWEQQNFNLHRSLIPLPSTHTPL